MSHGDSGNTDDSTELAQGTNGAEAGLRIRIVAIAIVLMAGVVFAATLILLKKPPAAAKVTEHSLSVDAVRVDLEDVPVTVTGLGEVRTLNVVSISSEISGVIVEIFPNLERGEIVPKGELLFRIDPRDYQAAKIQAEAQATQSEKTIERLNRQYAIDRARLKTLERSEVLTQREFERARDLLEKGVGARASVDRAEVTLNQTTDARDQLAQIIALYPVRIQEAQSALEGAKAQLLLTQANLARTEVRAPFDARIKQVSLEKGQYVSPGMQLLALADDRLLEITVSLDSRDAKDWLQFDNEAAPGAGAWFGKLKPLTCGIFWTEDPEHHRWEGVVHRIETFDRQNRTVSVAIRITSEAAMRSTGGLPLVEGMFCSVAIPGKTMKQVYRLPRWAVTYEGEIFVIRDGRLAIQVVDVIRSEGEETFVRGGLSPGERVITTRLVNPLPNRRIRTDESEGSNP